MLGITGFLGARQARGECAGGESADYEHGGECGKHGPKDQLGYHGDHLSLGGFVDYDLEQCLWWYRTAKGPMDLDLRRVLERRAVEDTLHGALAQPALRGELGGCPASPFGLVPYPPQS